MNDDIAAIGKRKIVHIDMDAFYASVEQRDNPDLCGRPVVVAWKGKRSVVCAASYEARRFGVRSAMPAITAERLCPEAIFVPPDFTRYKAASSAIREIFQRHTDLIEPLSLDEAYLDVTMNKLGIPTATLVAKTIRKQIYDELNLTASAGVAPNKFLAKIASDWRKPNGQFVLQPHEVQDFLLTLPVGRIPGVGKVTEARMAKSGIKLVGDIHAMDLVTLEAHFGNYAQRLFELARGIDHNPVVANRVRKQVSAEDTFPEDIPLTECEPHIRRLAEKVWIASKENLRQAKTVVLKLRTKEFDALTRSSTPAQPITDCETLIGIALSLCARVELSPSQLYRLVGVGLSNFQMHEGTLQNSDQLLLDDPVENALIRS
ncbi:MAG: DNA polymerase IV [Acidobacteriaceae bacterium]|nr:DNA polymerase IV [Acidobacteriaceae bacterium]